MTAFLWFLACDPGSIGQRPRPGSVTTTTATTTTTLSTSTTPTTPTVPWIVYPTCHGDPGPADKVRKLVVSHPYDGSGRPDTRYEVLTVDQAGTIATTGTVFRMGRSSLAEIAFTRDGAIGIAVQDDGTLGIFRFEGDDVVVVHEGFGAGDFYAYQVTVHPDGTRLWVTDGNWAENGGGLHEVAIDCDGVPTWLGRRLPAKQPVAVLLDPVDPDRAVLAAREVGTNPDQAYLLDLGNQPEPEVLGSSAAFPDDEAFMSSVAWTATGAFLLVADNNFGGGNRVAIVAMTADGLVPDEVITGIEDPFYLLASPFDDTVLVSSGFGDEMLALVHDGFAYDVVTVTGSALPAAAVGLTRGARRGDAFVADNNGVLHVRFQFQGVPTRVGAWTPGSGLENLVGSLGIQP